jgi:hypothetical protein
VITLDVNDICLHGEHLCTMAVCGRVSSWTERVEMLEICTCILLPVPSSMMENREPRL